MSSSSSENLGFDRRELAIEELNRGRVFTDQLWGLLQNCPPADPRSEALLNEVVRSIGVALAILEPCDRGEAAVVAAPASFAVDRVAGGGGGSASEKRKDVKIRERKRRSSTNSEVSTTDSPYYDDYQWRKYGQKDIQGYKFPREYFRCTYKDDHGCPATKLVQQLTEGDPPTYLLTRKNKHTCKTSIAPARITVSASTSLMQQQQQQYSQLLNFNPVVKSDNQEDRLLSLDVRNENNLYKPQLPDCTSDPHAHFSSDYLLPNGEMFGPSTPPFSSNFDDLSEELLQELGMGFYSEYAQGGGNS